MIPGNFLHNRRIWLVIALLVFATGGFVFLTRDKPVDFSADVKPILNKKCITCHGGVKAKAGFSVLFREEAMAPTESGKPAILPGDPDHSELIRRITNKDPEERMPYQHEPLSKDEIDIFRRWIKQGAKWGDHWAYLPVKQEPVPELQDAWCKNDIDKYILRKLKEQELQPSARADKATLLRRVSLDLIGMYPKDEIARKFMNSNDSNAYEVLVDSLLASPHYGERWAAMWLDLARYADTKGYEADGGRTIWPYRDWVIKAYNEDKPYDQFIKEQIAGDLFPYPTDDNYIATAFSRNSMTNDEGGTNNEEFRTSAVVDRVNTTWESMMGTTFACVQCHSHPYDPFHHDEYYKFLAYFNNTRDEDVPGEYPLLRQLTDSMKNEVVRVINWVKKNAGDEEAKRVDLFLRTYQPAINSTTADSIEKATIYGNNSDLGLMKNGSARLRNVNLQNSNQLVWHYHSSKKGGVVKFRLDGRQGPVFATTNILPGDHSTFGAVSYPLQSGTHDIYIEYQNPSIPDKSQDFALDFDWISFNREFPGKGLPGYEEQQNRYWSLVTANVAGIPVMIENPASMRRTTHVFTRGNWRSKGKEVEPAVPAALGFAMPKDAPKNRLGLAMWLTDERHPLVSRTMVNRLWEQVFGTGIVETLEDMGTQGIPPTHRELLDHLAYTFVHDKKWSVKKMLKEMVMSATYQQDSKLTEELKRKDFFNKFYARGPRVRLSSEQLRDQALCISGALSNKMYGEGVMPWQPEGIWLSPYNGAKWVSSKGEDQYRRAVYTYWKRTAAYPSLISFDGALRVVCTARRIRTNTPLQALVTLNDSAFVDLAGHFARRMMQDSTQGPAIQIAKGYELMLYKPMPKARLPIFLDLYNKALEEYKGRKDRTSAAMFVVANALLNLDEVVTKN
ncbi:DUF1553 domain-containing protein [Flavihumibacter profundi]|uniref:DUF1553 domain-containing protein n=1 Tax=Flavihumibacter profundi TaxID=2716883 RepID=UPI001CC4847C|nr:DUF1553 domain-containing protein [Flavihumibacter profundi]MBZ5855973.1 DUF1549 domain-containing protein [Flavihumibacter profundi]